MEEKRKSLGGFIAIFLFVLIILVAVIFDLAYIETVREYTPANIEKILCDYKTNSISAETFYEQRPFSVTGTVSSINADEIELKSDEGIGILKFGLRSKSKYYGSVNIGDEVTINARVVKFVTNANGTLCVILKI